jgi:hypothetical protein
VVIPGAVGVIRAEASYMSVYINNSIDHPVPVNVVSGGGGGGGNVNVTNTSLPVTNAAGEALIVTINYLDIPLPISGSVSLNASTTHLGEVSVSNFPSTTSVSNFPSTQTVSVSNFPSTQNVGIVGGSSHIGEVSVSNFPSTQSAQLLAGSAHVGEVSVSNFPTTVQLNAGTSHVGEVSVSNLPSIQSVLLTAGSANVGEVSVSNFPTTQSVSFVSTPLVALATGASHIGEVSVSNLGPLPSGFAQLSYALNVAYASNSSGAWVSQRIVPSLAPGTYSYILSASDAILSSVGASTSLWALVAVAAGTSAPTTFPNWSTYTTGSSFGSYAAGLGAIGSLGGALPSTLTTPIATTESSTFNGQAYEKQMESTSNPTVSATADIYLVGYLISTLSGPSVSRCFQARILGL